jgi:hypothetical protein
VAHAETAQLAAAVGALGTVLALLAARRGALLGGLALLAAAEAGMGLSLVRHLSLSSVGVGPAAAAAGVLGLAVLCAAAALLVRWPALVPPAVLVAAPLRPPLRYDSSSKLLVAVAHGGQLGRLFPLYFVLAAAALALAWRALRGAELAAIPRVIALPAAAFLGFSLLSIAWGTNVRSGTNLLVFFTLPFTVLLAVVARAPFPPWSARVLAQIGVGLAALFALVGLWEEATGKLLFFAPNLEVANANSGYFRVTSLFGDPSLYGRHLVLGLAILLVLLALRRVRGALALAALALLWAGLLFSYSQSSMAALLVVTLAIAAVTGDARVRRVVAAVGVIAVIAGAAFVAVKVGQGESLNRASSDRVARVKDTARVFAKHPLVGVGTGGQPRASRAAAHSARPSADFVSHTTPLTVAAELGIVGFALYVWLLFGAARLLDAVRRRDAALGVGLGAVFLALFVHSLFYPGVLQDPITWFVLAVGAGELVARRRPAPVAAGRRATPAPVAP